MDGCMVCIAGVIFLFYGDVMFEILLFELSVGAWCAVRMCGRYPSLFVGFLLIAERSGTE